VPGSTSTFAIPFPCVGDAIDPAQFASYSFGVEAALGTVWADATSALQPPAVSVKNTLGQNIATGVTATLNYNIVNYDRGGFFTAAAPTILTIPSAGSYFLSSSSSVNLTGNVTSVRWAFLRGGVEIAYWETQSDGVFSTSSGVGLNVLAVGMTAGEQITMNVLYTGATATLNFFGRITATRLAIP
jgi:hypothetical protein